MKRTENGNRFIKRSIDKGSDITDYTKLEIPRCIERINKYPDQITGYNTARECFNQKRSTA